MDDARASSRRRTRRQAESAAQQQARASGLWHKGDDTTLPAVASVSACSSPSTRLQMHTSTRETQADDDFAYVSHLVKAQGSPLGNRTRQAIHVIKLAPPPGARMEVDEDRLWRTRT